MRLSHESKVRLIVGIGAFVLIIGLVFGTSRTLIHYDGPWGLGDIASGLSGVDHEDDKDLGGFRARPLMPIHFSPLIWMLRRGRLRSSASPTGRYVSSRVAASQKE